MCSDPERTWFPQRGVCYSSMERASAQRTWDELHADGEGGAPWHDGRFGKWSAKRTKRTPFHRSDGVTIFAADTDLGLGGDFLGRDKKKKP